jgi:hypothetical protein
LNSWKIARCGFSITWVKHVEAAAVGHAEHDVLDAQLTAALDDLFKRGISASPPSRPKRLVPVYLTSRNFSKPSASTAC